MRSTVMPRLNLRSLEHRSSSLLYPLSRGRIFLFCGARALIHKRGFCPRPHWREMQSSCSTNVQLTTSIPRELALCIAQNCGNLVGSYILTFLQDMDLSHQVTSFSAMMTCTNSIPDPVLSPLPAHHCQSWA